MIKFYINIYLETFFKLIIFIIPVTSLVVVHLLAHWYRENHGKTHQSIGILLIVVGIALTVIFRMTYQNSDRNAIITGILLVFFGSCVKGISMNIVDHNFKSLNNPALSVTGIKSLYGILVSVLLYILFNFIKMGPPFNVLDNIKEIPAEIEEHPVIVFTCIALFLLSTIYEASAMVLIKNGKPENRIAIDVIRILIVSPMSLAIGWEPQSLLVFVFAILSLIGLFVYFDSTLLIKMYKALFIRARRSAFSEEETSNITQSSPSDTA